MNELPTPDPLYPGGVGNKPPKMNPERKAQWVAALRSGQYEQIGDMLRDALDDNYPPKTWGYCCLGVACDVHDPHLWEASDLYEGEASVLPDSVLRWLWDLPKDAQIMGGMRDPLVLVVPRSGLAKRWVALSALNDTFCWDFNAIADAIEEQL